MQDTGSAIIMNYLLSAPFNDLASDESGGAQTDYSETHKQQWSWSGR